MRVLLCPLSDGGYLYPALALGRELERRGHRIDVLGRAGAAPAVAAAGLPFAAAEDFGGHGAFAVARWGRSGLTQYRATVRAARQSGADVLVTSVLCTGTLLAAEVLDVPVAVIGLAAHLWDYASGGEGEPQPGNTTRRHRTAETRRLYAELRERAGLKPGGSRWGADPMPGEVLLLRGDPALEFPGARLPARVRQVGPLAWEPAADPAELASLRERLARSGKPVVYVHLGRVFGGDSLWPLLNAAFTDGRFQAVVELGRSGAPRPAPDADILPVRKPWMGPLIDLAGLVLTNATSAPVLAALLRGRALAVAPNGAEQPLLAGACVRAGVAAHLPRSRRTNGPALLDPVWRNAGLRIRAAAIGRQLAAADGAARAADTVERVARASAAASAPLKEDKDHGFATSRP